MRSIDSTMPPVRFLALVAGALLFAAPGLAQDPPASPDPDSSAERCRPDTFGEFDFWLGRWEVHNPDGELVGHNEITRVSRGCGLLEVWTGVRGGRGVSVNAYDPDLGRWTQRWVGEGTSLWLEGGWTGDRMELVGTLPRTTPRGEVIDRITWTPLADGRVRQVWEVSAVGGGSWEGVFVGLYSPVPAPPDDPAPAVGEPGADRSEPTVRPGDGQLDGRRIAASTNGWRSYRVSPNGDRRLLANWHDTITVVRGDGQELLRRVQWILPEGGEATVLINEADRATLVPRRAVAGPVDGEPFIDLRWWGVLVAALPLEPDYAARFFVFATELGIESPLAWITARVVGDEMIDGVSCWVVDVDAGRPWTLWIAQDRERHPVRRIRIQEEDGSALLWEMIAESDTSDGS